MASFKLYFGIWLVLIVATILEVATRLLPSEFTLLVAGIIAIASVKAVLIALYYQHLRYENKLLGLIPLGGLGVIIALLITAIVSLGM